MRSFLLIFFAILSNLTYSQSTSSKESTVATENLVGEWILDLRPSPDALPYLQTFIVSQQGEKNFEGTFYGSPVKKACLNTNWDKMHFAFKSSDNSNAYYHSGYIIGDEIFGTTFCPNRNFIMPWSGKRDVQ